MEIGLKTWIVGSGCLAVIYFSFIDAKGDFAYETGE